METQSNTERLEKLRKILLFFVPLVYVVVLSFSFTDKFFPLDDGPELAFVRGMDSKWDIFGPDVFGLFRPIKNLVFLLFSHLSVFGIKWCRLLALAVGVLSFFPVLTLCRRLLANEYKALVAASVWLLSPTLVSSVAWLSCVNIQIMAMFSAMAIVVHDSAWNDNLFRSRRSLVAGMLLFLALISYESAISVIPILFLFDFLLRPGRCRDRNAWMAYGYYVTVAVVYLTLRHANHSSTGLNGNFDNLIRWQIIVSSPFFVVEHFATWFWPFGRMAVVGSYKWGMVPVWRLVLCACILAATGIVAFAIRRKSPVICFCMLFSLLAIAPVSNCLGFGNGPYGDYYLTFVSIGLAAGCIEAISVFSEARSSVQIVATTIIAVFACVRLAAIPEAARWAWLWGRGTNALAESERTFPGNFTAQIQLAQLFFDQGFYSESEDICKKLEPLFSEKSRWKGRIYLLRSLFALNVEQDADAALGFLECWSLTEAGPIDARRIHYYRGCVFEDLKDDNETAAKEYEFALSGKWDIDSVPCADRLARLKAVRGERDEAIALWERALRVNPENEAVLWNLFIAYREAGDMARLDELRRQAEAIVREKTRRE